MITLTPLFISLRCLCFESIRGSYTEALLAPAWKQVIDEEMEALTSRGTWELISAATDTVVVGCRWVFI